MNKTAQKKKQAYKKPLSRPASLVDNPALRGALLAAALVFNVVFGCVRNPLGEDNTISWIGFDHPYMFIIWAGLTASALFVNIAYMYRRYNYSGILGTIALHAAPFGAVTIVFINDNAWEHVVHWIGAIAFVAFNGAALLLFFLHNFKKHKNYRIITLIVAAVLLCMVVVLLTVGKSGLLELVPLWLSLILLYVINFTDFLPVVEEPAEIPEPYRLKKKASHLAGVGGMFGAHDFYMGKTVKGEAHLMLTYVGALFCLSRFIGFGAVNEYVDNGVRALFDQTAVEATKLLIPDQADAVMRVEMMFMGEETAAIFLAAGACCLLASLIWALSERKQIRNGEMNTDADGNPLVH